MDIEVRSWLFDILNAINEIDSFFVNNSLDFTYYQNDLKTRRAVERNLEIIGEAVNRIVQKNDNISLRDSRKIIDTRNRIIHAYDNVSDDIIWSIIITHLPILKLEVENYLGE